MSEEKFIYRSCDAVRLYDGKNFPESDAVLLDLTRRPSAGEYIGTLFPNFSYNRIYDARDIAAGAYFKEQLNISRNAINAGKSGASSGIFKFENATIRDRVIYVKDEEKYSIVYETHRPCDRENSSLATLDELDTAPSGAGDDEICLFMGSTGCFNYGHWLSDDLIKISAFWAVRKLHQKSHIVIVVAAHNTRIDKIKEESIRFLLSNDHNFSIRVFARPAAISFKYLYYASPASSPGTLKSPEGIGYLHASAIEALMRHRPAAAQGYMKAYQEAGDMIFVDRGPGYSRGLTNSAEIYHLLKQKGFKHINPEDFSFVDQVEIFSRASVVIGNMGAGMTNTIFCRPNSRIIYLAPEGWDDAFFWDLANVMNQKHQAIYGPRHAVGDASNYEIDPSLVIRILEDKI